MIVKGYEKLSFENINEITELMDRISELQMLEAEFAVELCGLLHLVLIFESLNVYEENNDSPQIGVMLECSFMCDYDRYFATFGRTNEKRSLCYRNVNKYLEELLEEYADKSYDVRKVVIALLEILPKKVKEGESEAFYALVCALAYPVYKSFCGERVMLF